MYVSLRRARVGDTFKNFAMTLTIKKRPPMKTKKLRYLPKQNMVKRISFFFFLFNEDSQQQKGKKKRKTNSTTLLTEQGQS